jgi:hypothetical protein
MFEFDPDAAYMMPAHFGVRRPPGRGKGRYLDTTGISVSYLTERAALERFVPRPFELREPVVTVSYSMNRQIEWLAGGAYNIVSVGVPVVFHGEEDGLEGSYSLVLWENDTDAILMGREVQGFPKIFADIEDHQVIEGEWHTSAAHRGTKFVDIWARNLEPIAPERVAAMNAAAAKSTSFTWKYFQNTGRPGPRVSSPVAVPSGGNVLEAWTATGEVRWQAVTWEQNPTQFHIINALAALPSLGHRGTTVARRTGTMFDPTKKPLRELKWG